jgi:hypothetical protein
MLEDGAQFLLQGNPHNCRNPTGLTEPSMNVMFTGIRP